jgi:hypothetical protein
MLLFQGDSGSRVVLDAQAHQACHGVLVTVWRLVVVQLDGTEVLGALVGVLLGADQPERRAVAGLQGGPVEAVRPV